MAVRHAAVLGSPIEHSLSPVLHNAAYAALQLDWEYSKHDVSTDDLQTFVDQLDDSWAGLSLTMPLKEVAFTVADSVSETARLTGSINTLLLDSHIHGDNTDVYGVVEALRESGLESASTAAVIGSGATARSAIVALASIGVQDLSLVARNPQTAESCIELAHELGITHTEVVQHGRHLGRNEVVISTVPKGVADNFVTDVHTSDGLLLDVVYHPWPTRMAEHWSNHGGRVASGHLMLLHQAAKQVTLMTHMPAPVEKMRFALELALH